MRSLSLRLLSSRLLALPALLALALTLTLLGAPSGAAAPSYPITCVGGGGMGLEVGSDDNVLLRVHFEPGTQAASAGGLRPGQCTWLDRGMDPSEPRVLEMILNMQPRLMLPASGRPTYLGPRGASSPDAIQKFELIWNGVFQGQTFHVHARRDGNTLAVTRFGP